MDHNLHLARKTFKGIAKCLEASTFRKPDKPTIVWSKQKFGMGVKTKRTKTGVKQSKKTINGTQILIQNVPAWKPVLPY